MVLSIRMKGGIMGSFRFTYAARLGKHANILRAYMSWRSSDF